MYVIVGLGNPGDKYENTRHNIGFVTLDHLANELNISVTKSKFRAIVGDGRIGREKVLLVKPQTYMNDSGDSIRQVLDYFDVDLEKLIVIYDDMDLEVGDIRIRKHGGAGTHNGMKSVIQHVGSEGFPRIRIGIGDKGSKDAIGHVLGGFSKEEVSTMEDAVKDAAAACEAIVTDGIDRAMNKYNRKA